MKGDAWQEQGLVFQSGERRLVGIVARPDKPASVGVILLVGGPQYRVGSHRQFALLARQLADAGIASLRFDYAGMGDSEGEAHDFSSTDADLRAALAALRDAVAGVERFVLWGLCDAASSAMMFAHGHPGVVGLVLLNPWVHGEDYSPNVKVAQYYGPLLTGRESWRRLFSGEIDLWPALRDLAGSSLHALAGRLGLAEGSFSRHSFVRQMLEGFRRFEGDSLVILSEDDLTAGEFSSLVERDRQWSEATGRPGVETHTIAGADHTFSSGAWKDEVAQLTIDWVSRRQ